MPVNRVSGLDYIYPSGGGSRTAESSLGLIHNRIRDTSSGFMIQIITPLSEELFRTTIQT